MALFQGEQLVDIVTPDGRTMQVPASIAQGLQGIQTAPTARPQANPMPTTQAPTAADIPPESVTGGALPGTQNPYTLPTGSSPVQNTPDYVVPDPTVAAQKSAPARAAQAKKAAQAQQRQAVAAASPPGQRAVADRQTQNALGEEKQAMLDASTVEAAAQDEAALAAQGHNEAINKLIDDRATEARANLEAEQKKNDEIVGLRKKIAGTKIDRKADHPIVAAIGIALAGLGSAMQNRYTNQPPSMAALDTFWKALDRKVNNQMADLDLMEKTYGMAKDELGSLKEMGGRKLELYNTLLAGEGDKAKRHLDEIIAKSSSEKTRANAKLLAAQIDERVAAAHTEAMRWGQEYDQRDAHQKQQIGLGYAQLGESRRSNMANEELKREEMYLDSQKYLAGLKAKGDEEAYKVQLKQTEEVSKRGLRGTDGELLLMPKGRELADQAKQLEDEAAKTEEAGKADPAAFGANGGQQRAQMLREKAAQLRGEANNNAVLGYNDTDAKEISNAVAAGQSTVQLIDDIKRLAKTTGRSFLSRSKEATVLRSEFNQLAPYLKDAWQLGAWDKGAANLVTSITGSDPSSEWNAGTIGAIMQQKMIEDPDAFLGNLDSIAKGLEVSAQNKLIQRGARFKKGETVLQRAQEIDTNTPTAKAVGALSGSTPAGTAEKITAKGEGLLKGGAHQLAYHLNKAANFLHPDTPDSPEEDARQQENSGSVQYAGRGLTDNQAKGFDTLFNSYKKGNKGDGDQIVAAIANNVEKQPDLSIALMHNLREFSPDDLYQKARAALPPNSTVDQQMAYEESSRAGSAMNDTPTLAANVINTLDNSGNITNQTDYKELTDRATAGDKAAGKAILGILSETGKRKAAPTPRGFSSKDVR
jgi:hypothetical protein